MWTAASLTHNSSLGDMNANIAVGDYVVYGDPVHTRLLYCRVQAIFQVPVVQNQNFIAFASSVGRLNVPYNAATLAQVHRLPRWVIPRARAAIGVIPPFNLAPVLAVLQAILRMNNAVDFAVSDVGAAVTAAAVPGVFGGASVMSGLATVGGTVGAGAVGGILVVAGGPAMAVGGGICTIIDAVEDDETAAVAGKAGVCAGGACGLAATVTSVYCAGVTGLSGAGITSGLAALGGGSLAAGGSGMALGLTACCGIFTAPVIVIGLGTWGVYWAVLISIRSTLFAMPSI
ncbi:hypothetical protein H072_7542 [Dactylellina haptotyla CBS 200.50]|uniref:Uncharacterized protein n=1 Tax=Dactylellina haptotyla (strain CBS 200.50) TaxID=1284197 RepID=S8A768_DACHA|nr:hypothetical protein H072_7542 [Dactylellina haptotyla CBS 200.50]